MKMDGEMSGQGIQSLELGLKILKQISEANKPLSITEISEICSITKSKLHRYLTSLTRAGFLQRDSTLHYTFGTELIAIGLNSAKSLKITDAAKPVLFKLKEHLNETVFLSIWGTSGPFPIDMVKSDRSVSIGITVGSHTSTTLTTAGLLFTAYLPKEMTHTIIQKELADNGMEAEPFFEKIQQIRDTGFCITQETLVPGIIAVGCPVFGINGEIIATISVVGIAGLLDLSPESDVIKLLMDECENLSRSLKYGE